LVRILAVSGRAGLNFSGRQHTALEAYVESLSSPPVGREDVLRAARALIRVWAESACSPKRSRAIEAILLDLEIDDVDRTEQMVPSAISSTRLNAR
jgi:hypothetical protein